MNFIIDDKSFRVYNEAFNFMFILRKAKHNMVEIYLKLKNMKTFKPEKIIEEFGTEIS